MRGSLAGAGILVVCAVLLGAAPAHGDDRLAGLWETPWKDLVEIRPVEGVGVLAAQTVERTNGLALQSPVLTNIAVRGPDVELDVDIRLLVQERPAQGVPERLRFKGKLEAGVLRGTLPRVNIVHLDGDTEVRVSTTATVPVTFVPRYPDELPVLWIAEADLSAARRDVTEGDRLQFVLKLRGSHSEATRKVRLAQARAQREAEVELARLAPAAAEQAFPGFQGTVYALRAPVQVTRDRQARPGTLWAAEGDVLTLKYSYARAVAPVVPPVRLLVTQVEGFIEQPPVPVDAGLPALPRFFVDAQGRPSIDVAAEQVPAAATVRLRIVDAAGSELHAADVAVDTAFTASPGANGRWKTVALSPVFAEAGVDLLQVRDFRVVMDVTPPGGNTVTHTSPPADRYRAVEWARQRARHLAQWLFSQPLDQIRLHTPESRRRRAWQTFLAYADVRVDFEVVSRDGRAIDAQPVHVYAWMAQASGAPVAVFQETKTVAVPAGDAGPSFVVLDASRLAAGDGEGLRRLRGLHLLAVADPAMWIRHAVENDASVRIPFTADPDSPQRAAARLIRFMKTRDGLDDVAAKDRFLAVANTSGDRAFGAAQAAAREWDARIDEFERLLTELDAAFTTAEIATMHRAIADDRADHKIHIGLPSVVEPRPMRAPGAPRTPDPGFAIDRVWLLPRGDSEVFWRAAMAASGLDPSELPPPSDEFLARDLTRNRRSPVVHDSESWQTPEGYPDAFLGRLSPQNRRTLQAALAAENPTLNGTKGLVQEIRMAEAAWERVRSEPGRAGNIYVPGYRLLIKTAAGQLVQGPDGLELAPRPTRADVEYRYEGKSGPHPDNLAKGPRQLVSHAADMRRDGLWIADPTPGEVTRLGAIPGAQRLRIPRGGAELDVLYLSASALNVKEGADRRVLVLPFGVRPPVAAPGHEYTLRRTEVSARQLEAYANETMLRLGLPAVRWNDRELGMTDSWNLYQRQLRELGVPEGRGLSRKHHARLWAQGQQFNPESNAAEPIYSAPHFNPLRVGKNVAGNPDTGLRFGKHPASMWQSEALMLYEINELDTRPGLPRAERDRLLAEARRALESGQMYDWRDPDPAKRFKPRTVHRAEGEILRIDFDPDSPEIRKLGEADRQRVLVQRRKAQRALAAMVAQMATEGLLEADRARREFLEVTVKRKVGSPHVFIQAVRMERNAKGELLVPHRDDYAHPLRQRWLLMRYFEASLGWGAQAGAPEWLRTALPDGDQYTSWEGQRRP
jgi:hypothetical protein